MSNPAQVKKRNKPEILLATIVYSIVFLFVTWTFPAYFYFLPPQDTDIRPLLLWLYLVAWPLAVILPPAILLKIKSSGFTKVWAILYLVSVLSWPVITVAVKIRELIVLGTASIEYWAIYPIFIFLEVLWPVFVLVVYIVWQRVPSVSKNHRRLVKKQIRNQYKTQLAAAKTSGS